MNDILYGGPVGGLFTATELDFKDVRSVFTPQGWVRLDDWGPSVSLLKLAAEKAQSRCHPAHGPGIYVREIIHAMSKAGSC